jgi:hypothetical protein
MPRERSFKEKVIAVLRWVATTGIWLVYRYEPGSPEGDRHKVRIGLAAFDDDLLASYVARSERSEDHEDDSPFRRF